MRGSRPGERRGGRQKGTPNKKTALAQAAIAARAANGNLSPLDLMLAIMRDPHVALVTRVKMALRALPLLHTKLKAVPSGSSGLGHNGAAVPSSDAAKKSNSGRKSAPATHGDAKAEAGDNSAAAASAPNDSLESSRKSTTNDDASAELGSGGAAAQSVDRSQQSGTDSRNSAPATNGEATTEAGAKHPDLMPLDFLLSVMRHPKTPATLRIKVALATQPYLHPRKSNRLTTPVAVAGDRHGFEVEPALAKKLRNEIARLGQFKRRRHPRPEDQKTVQKLNQKIEAKIATLQCPCPSRYSVKDAANDHQALIRLWQKRRSRAKLTAREDTALAHINARYTAYSLGPEARARARLAALRKKRRVGRPRLSPHERAELRCLTTLYPPELSEIDEDFLARESAFATLDLPDFHAGESTFEDFEEFVEVPPFFTGNPNSP
jgi:hypothetical protein